MSTAVASPARKPLSRKDWFEVLRKSGFACTYCGRKPPAVELCIDHKIPISRGGSDEEGNLVASCTDCNSGKSDSWIFDGPAPPLLRRQDRAQRKPRKCSVLILPDGCVPEEIGPYTFEHTRCHSECKCDAQAVLNHFLAWELETGFGWEAAMGENNVWTIHRKGILVRFAVIIPFALQVGPDDEDQPPCQPNYEQADKVLWAIRYAVGEHWGYSRSALHSAAHGNGIYPPECAR